MMTSLASPLYPLYQVFGGQDDSAPHLLTLCHQQTQPTVVTTQGNHAFVRFASDQSVKGKGFNISYTTLPEGEIGATTKACPKDISTSWSLALYLSTTYDSFTEAEAEFVIHDYPKIKEN